MITTTITNAGAPFTDASGSPQSGVSIKFTLVDRFNKPLDTFDATTGERISYESKSALTDSSGVFVIDLFPTARASDDVYYLCESPYTRPFRAPLDEAAAVTWAQFKAAGVTLTPNGNSAFTQHTADTDLHITATERTALDAANSPTASNPLATLLDISIAQGTVDASDSVKGISQLSVAPVSTPIAVGDNDPRVPTEADNILLARLGVDVDGDLTIDDAKVGAATGGHTILDSGDNVMATRSKLKLVKATGTTSSVTVTDDGANDTTIVTITFPTTIDGGTWT